MFLQLTSLHLKCVWLYPGKPGNFIFQGHMPTTQLLKKYDLMQFAEVTKSVRYDDCFIALCVITKKKNH